jgi:glucosamine-6-phosphate deaminase
MKTVKNTEYKGTTVSVYDNKHEASIAVAQQIADLIKSRSAAGEKAVLGLATGATPIEVYNELIRLHKEEGLSFQNVVTFNLDEYYPMKPTAKQSYVAFMHEHLFDHVDIVKENINIPDGEIASDDVAAYCEAYEQKITSYGGLDLQLLGIGQTGHVGFNEPGSTSDSLTRLVELNEVTRADAAANFDGIANVPTHAITMGVGTIAKAKKIILMAWGEGKANIVQKALESEITTEVPATYLQEFDGVEMVLDEGAATKLKI